MASISEKKLALQSPRRHPYSVSSLKSCITRTKLCQIIEFFAVFIPIRAVIYLTSSTAAAAKKQKHKSLSSDNVFSALEEIEFENFIEPLRDALETFRHVSKEKKIGKTNDSKIEEAPNTNGNEDSHTATDEDMNDSMLQN